MKKIRRINQIIDLDLKIGNITLLVDGEKTYLSLSKQEIKNFKNGFKPIWIDSFGDFKWIENKGE